jgi:endonuclease/exonuclease/phosphatase family metal-dependent hydrolase
LTDQEIINLPPIQDTQTGLLNHLRLQVRRWSHIPWLWHPFSLLRRGMSVAEPTSMIHIRRVTHPSGQNSSDSITVMSANLCHDWPLLRSQTRRLEAFAELAEEVKADIILLQEVSRTSSLFVDKWLVQRLGMSSLYARANGSSQIGFEEGLALLSRFHLTQPRLAELRPASTSFVRRLALGAQAATPAGPLWIFSVHLGLNHRHNLAQQANLRRMISMFPANQPALLGGDFNSDETTPQIRENSRVWVDTYRYLHPEADATTHAIKLPGGGSFLRRRLDYIYLRSSLMGWEIQETGHLHSRRYPHSDHFAVYTRLTPVKC